MTDFARSLLPHNATPWELAAEATGGARFDPLLPDAIQNLMAIRAQARPGAALVPASLLAWLAWHLGLEIWNPDWPEARKRWAVANSIHWHKQKGTLAGIGAYLNLVDCSVAGVLTPPARPFAAPPLTQDQRLAYLAGFPQLRVLPYVAAALQKYAAFAGAAYGFPKSFAGYIFPHDMLTQNRYTRTAELWDNGARVKSLTLRTVFPGDIGSISDQIYDEIVVPVTPPPRQLYCGAFYPGPAGSGQAIVGAGFQASTIVRVGVTTSWVFAAPRVSTQTVKAGLGLVDTTPDDVAETHTAIPGQTFATKRAFAGKCFAATSVAWQYLYQRWYLFDPSRVPPSRSSRFFAGWARLGMPAYSAELQVDIPRTKGSREFWKFATGFVRPSGLALQQIDDALMAVRTSKSARDRILVNTKTVRTIEPRDRIPVGQAKVGGWTANAPSFAGSSLGATFQG